MGAIAPSKLPKARNVIKRDGKEPTKVFKEGGKVRRFNAGGENSDMERDVKKRQESRSSSGERPSGPRFTGGGGKDNYVTSGGGRLSYDIPVGKDATLSPYLEGFVAKPKEGKLTGKLTGAGVMFKKPFKDGGKVNEAGNYTKPGMRKGIFSRVKAGGKGGAPGQWSARKAQMVAVQYKKAGGGYRD